MSHSIKFVQPSRPLTWLITGTSSGLGLSLARLVQQHGHRLIATSRNPSQTPSLVAEIESRGGTWLPLDLTTGVSNEKMADTTSLTDLIAKLNEGSSSSSNSSSGGGICVDVLVNNAGSSVLAPVECLVDDEIQQQMELLFFGPMRLVRAAVVGMRKRRFGVIVNVSSGAALEGRESMGAYAAGKAAMDAMTTVLAKEVAPFNVRALTVSLGSFNTNMGTAVRTGERGLPDDYQESTTDHTMHAFSRGTFVPDGDKEKAMQVVYDVVMGQGTVGQGHEGERFLPLGRDLAAKVEQVQRSLTKSMEIFGDVCNNVYIDKN